MYNKFLILLLLVSTTLTAVSYARSTASQVVFQLPDANDLENEINGSSDRDHKLEGEKQMALMTNELKPSNGVASTPESANKAEPKTQKDDDDSHHAAAASARPPASQAQFSSPSQSQSSSSWGFLFDMFVGILHAVGSWIYDVLS